MKIYQGCILLWLHGMLNVTICHDLTHNIAIKVNYRVVIVWCILPDTDLLVHRDVNHTRAKNISLPLSLRLFSAILFHGWHMFQSALIFSLAWVTRGYSATWTQECIQDFIRQRFLKLTTIKHGETFNINLIILLDIGFILTKQWFWREMLVLSSPNTDYFPE